MKLQGHERMDATIDSIWAREGLMSQEGCYTW